MKVQMNRRRGIFLMAILLSTIAGSAQAGGTKTVNLTLHLVITQPPPCTVNGASIEFGNVPTNKVGDATYTRPVEYSLSCTNAKVGDYLKLQIQGTTTTINGEAVLQTSVAGLGIRLQQAGSKTLVPVSSTTWLDFTLSGSQGPELEAIPVKDSAVMLSGGEFTASATLLVDYQ